MFQSCYDSPTRRPPSRGTDAEGNEPLSRAEVALVDSLQRDVGVHLPSLEQLQILHREFDRRPVSCGSAAMCRLSRLQQGEGFVDFSPLKGAVAELARQSGTGARAERPSEVGMSSAAWALLHDAAATDAACGAAIASFVGMVFGDALGHPLEFTPVDSRLPDVGGKVYSDHRRPCLLPDFIRRNPVYRNAYNKFSLRPGQWTDDSSMAFCLADSLLAKGSYHGGDARLRWHMWWTQGYCNAFRHDTGRQSRKSVGLGGNIAKSIQEVDRVASGLKPGQAERAVPWAYRAESNDAGNGSIMRLAPVPIAYRLMPQMALDVATLQSFATHPGPDAAACCCFMTFFVIEALQAHREERRIAGSPRDFMQEVIDSFLQTYDTDSGKPKARMAEFWGSPGAGHKDALRRLTSLLACKPPSKKELNWDWKRSSLAIREAIENRQKEPNGKYNGHPVIPTYFGAYCLDGLAMALWSLWHSASFKDCIIRVVNLLGDADTTAAIAGQLAGAVYGWDGLLAEQWGHDCLMHLRRWDPLAEVGLRAALLYHCFPTPAVVLKQAEGHPTVRVFEKPVGGQEPIGELANGVEVSVLESRREWFLVAAPDLQGWVGAKNIVEPAVPKPPNV